MRRQNDGTIKWTVRVEPDLAAKFVLLSEREHRSIEGQIRYLMERAVEADEEATT